MRNEDYNYVLIDLEGFIRVPLHSERNNWLWT